MRDHPLDRWFRAHHLHLRILLGICAIALIVGLGAGLDLLAQIAGIATFISGTLVMLYLPRSSP
ncbi:hypothetical protein [Solirubrobacter soli]|uniref:hypothetical protein n=1 Tax=Solirubrobacter soli TaxID=363832 RepID=UPI0012F97EB9|nr:hypothetical protein [Solirubrobacter soli]